MAQSNTALKAHRRRERLMGNSFELTVVSEDEAWAHSCIDAAVVEIKRIEALLTTYSDSSETAKVNAYAGISAVDVSPETFGLLQRAAKISALTQGAFDVSYGALDKQLWNFDVHMTALPGRQTALDSVRLINWRNIILNAEKSTVFLKEKGMHIGFGGIGKGYAADKAKVLLQELGVLSGVVNASGDLVAWGSQPNGSPWTVGIASPGLRHQPFSYLELNNRAVATSGDYEKFAVIAGRRYSHTIDPRTGFPVTGIKSVTVLCPSAELADALATPVLVMGATAGLALINQMRGVACILIDDNDRLLTSNNINISR